MSATVDRSRRRRRPTAAFPAGLPLRRRHRRLPDRGRRAAEDGRGESIWDRFCRTARRRGQRRHRRRRLRPLPPLARRPRPDGLAAAGELPLLDRVAARAARRARARSTRAGVDVLPAARRGAARARHRAGRDALPLGPARRRRQDAGGWASRDTAAALRRVRRARWRDELGDVVGGWITHNEPWVVAFLGHAYGRKAPGVARLADGADASPTTCCSRHGLAVDALRARGAGRAPVGITLNLNPMRPAVGDEHRARRRGCRRPPEPLVPGPGAARHLPARNARALRAALRAAARAARRRTWTLISRADRLPRRQLLHPD